MNRTTRLKKPQIPELDTLYQFNDLGGRPKYGGVEMTSETDIPSFQEIMDETHSAVVAEATARDDADDALQAQIDSLDSDLTAEITAREAADQAEATARAAADQAETTARTSADNNLQTQIDAIVASSDVKDIVGTYAELQAYDTSTLGDNDIIKVLQDETHQDETTYYRWVLADEEFSLIGEEGPYYTKAATDALLNDKADKATTYTKTETDAALALKADKATTYTKTETDALLGGKQNTLTAGDNITIDANNVISAAAGITKLTTADYNMPANNPQYVATWLLEPGLYVVDETGTQVGCSTSTHGSRSKGVVFLVAKNSGSAFTVTYGQAIGSPIIDVTNLSGAPYSGYQSVNVLIPNDIQDTLTSTSTNLPLSAKQGKVLNDKIGDLTTLQTTAKTNLVAAINELVESGASVSYYSNSELESLWEGGV